MELFLLYIIFIDSFIILITYISDCGTNVSIKNGYVNTTDRQTTYGESLDVTCDTGYELKGGTRVLCRANGNWSAETTCEIKGLHLVFICEHFLIPNSESDHYNSMCVHWITSNVCESRFWFVDFSPLLIVSLLSYLYWRLRLGKILYNTCKLF